MNFGMKNYEAIFILKPDLKEGADGLITSITGAIKDNNGKILKEENWGKRSIAYSIKSQKEGIYYKINFSIEPSSIDKLDKTYKLNTGILRTLIIKR